MRNDGCADIPYRTCFSLPLFCPKADPQSRSLAHHYQPLKNLVTYGCFFTFCVICSRFVELNTSFSLRVHNQGKSLHASGVNPRLGLRPLSSAFGYNLIGGIFSNAKKIWAKANSENHNLSNMSFQNQLPFFCERRNIYENSETLQIVNRFNF